MRREKATKDIRLSRTVSARVKESIISSDERSGNKWPPDYECADFAKAEEYRNKASAASNDLDESKASEFYFKAAHHYGQAGLPYREKYCESWGWAEKAEGIESSIPEENIRKAELYDNAVKAVNEALRYVVEEFGPTAGYTDVGNMRHWEGVKYRTLANVEHARAEKAAEKDRPEHLYRAAEYSQSGASSSKAAATEALNHDATATHHNRMGTYHNDLASYHYYRAWANDELGGWQESLEGYERAKEEGQQAIEEFRKALRLKRSKSFEQNLQYAEERIKEYIEGIAKTRLKAERVARAELPRPTPKGTAPSLDVHIESLEGIVENLVSTVTVRLENTGQADARNVKVELQSSFIEGETSATLKQLRAGKATRLGFSIISTKAGKPNAAFHINYEDHWGKSYSQQTDAVLEVARREEERPLPMTIINVKGDYVDDRDTIIQDSVINRSNIGAGGKSKSEELRDAKALLDDGIIDDAEFKQMKKEILGK